MNRPTIIGSRFWRFSGGLQLRHHKDESLECGLRTAPMPPRLVIPLNQQRSGSVTPCVAVGDRVSRGQTLAVAADGDGIPIHAPAAGIIMAIGPAPVIGRGSAPETCVTLATSPDGPDAFLEPIEQWRTASPDVLRARVEAAGVAGLGGALFSTFIKLRRGDAEATTLVVNGAECEPYIACDETLMRHQSRRVLEGAMIAARSMGAVNIVVAIEDQRETAAGVLDAAAQALGPGAPRIVRVPTIYPEGGEKQLVRVLTGDEIPRGGTPIETGLVCLNVGTVAAIHDAVTLGRPVISRTVTITGRGVISPCNLEAPIGAPAGWLVEQAGGYTEDVQRLVMGGPMMGIPLANDALPITKATNCLLALVGDDIRAEAPEMPCIRCMECVRVCPARLLPQQLFWHIKAGDYNQAQDHALADCIECGCCDQVCPSQIPLVDYYRHAKTELAARRSEAARATQARARFEARETRLERIEAERQARLAARQASLKSAGARKTEIAAAVARSRAKKQTDSEA